MICDATPLLSSSTTMLSSLAEIVALAETPTPKILTLTPLCLASIYAHE